VPLIVTCVATPPVTVDGVTPVMAGTPVNVAVLAALD
jgi:hypothetical protein